MTMPKSFKTIIAALALVILGVALYNWFAFVDQRQVRKTLCELEERLSAPPGSGLDAALAGAALKPLFAPEVSVAVLRDGREWRRDFGRDELLRIILGAKQGQPDLKVSLDFSLRDVKVADGGTATVGVLVKVENFNEPIEPQRLTFTLGKADDGRWRLVSVGVAA
ncbi:MAG: hypothetical protein LBP68_00800 [Acidobacteriota bacterium]|jgi:hypothetical protein|nr:hypothetical protein [Acidobacteriota bacterium]